MKPFKVTLALGSILAVLALLAVWDEDKTKKESDQKEQESKIFSFEMDAVKNLTLAIRSQAASENSEDPVTEIVIKREGDGWQIIQPVNTLGETLAIQNLIENLRSYQYEKIIEKPASLSDYGLSPAFIEASVALADGSIEGLKIGKKAPVGYSLYSQKLGTEQVYIGSQYLEKSLNKSLHDLREKKLKLPKLVTIDTLVYTKGGESLLSFKYQDNDWVFQQSGKPVDEDSMSELISMLRSAKVGKFIDEPSEELIKALAQADPKAFLGKIRILEKAGETPWVLELYKKDGTIWGRASTYPGVLLRFDEATASIFDFTAWDFQDKRLFNFDSSEVVALSLEGEKYRKQTNQWQKESDPEPAGMAKYDHIRSLIIDLEMAKIAENDSALAASLPSYENRQQIVLEFVEDKAVSFWFWSEPQEDYYWIQKEGEPEAFKVEREVFANLRDRTQASIENDEAEEF